MNKYRGKRILGKRIDGYCRAEGRDGCEGEETQVSVSWRGCNDTGEGASDAKEVIGEVLTATNSYDPTCLIGLVGY